MVKYLEGAYPFAASSPNTLSAFRDALAKVRTDLLMPAARLWVSRSRFFPTPADLLAAVAESDTPDRRMAALEARFYEDGTLEADDWRALIDRFREAGRFEMASFALERSRRLAQLDAFD